MKPLTGVLELIANPGQILRKYYIRRDYTEASWTMCPSHSWTLAISAEIKDGFAKFGVKKRWCGRGLVDGVERPCSR
jgi:hypothetical protein